MSDTHGCCRGGGVQMENEGTNQPRGRPSPLQGVILEVSFGGAPPRTTAKEDPDE